MIGNRTTSAREGSKFHRNFGVPTLKPFAITYHDREDIK